MSTAGETRVTRASARRARQEEVNSDTESEPREGWSVEAVTGIPVLGRIPVRIEEEEVENTMDNGYVTQTPEGGPGTQGDNFSMAQRMQMFMQQSMREADERRRTAEREAEERRDEARRREEREERREVRLIQQMEAQVVAAIPARSIDTRSLLKLSDKSELARWFY